MLEYGWSGSPATLELLCVHLAFLALNTCCCCSEKWLLDPHFFPPLYQMHLEKRRCHKCNGLVTSVWTHKQIYEKRNQQGNQGSIIWWRPLIPSIYSIFCMETWLWIKGSRMPLHKNGQKCHNKYLKDWLVSKEFLLPYPFLLSSPRGFRISNAASSGQVVFVLVYCMCLTQSAGWVWLEALVDQ